MSEKQSSQNIARFSERSNVGPIGQRTRGSFCPGLRPVLRTTARPYFTPQSMQTYGKIANLPEAGPRSGLIILLQYRVLGKLHQFGCFCKLSALSGRPLCHKQAGSRTHVVDNADHAEEDGKDAKYE